MMNNKKYCTFLYGMQYYETAIRVSQFLTPMQASNFVKLIHKMMYLLRK